MSDEISTNCILSLISSQSYGEYSYISAWSQLNDLANQNSDILGPALVNTYVADIRVGIIIFH